MKYTSLIQHFLLATAIVLAASCVSTKKSVKENNIPPKETARKDSSVKTYAMPPREVRAVWVATIGGIDWPREHFTEAAQKAWYDQMLDTLQKLNINTVYFQVRPKADAFYDSPYEPWSQYVTGYRGKAPTYDVLKWVIDETHRRGMSFHAWIRSNGPTDGSRNSTRRFPKTLSKTTAWYASTTPPCRRLAGASVTSLPTCCENTMSTASTSTITSTRHSSKARR